MKRVGRSLAFAGYVVYASLAIGQVPGADLRGRYAAGPSSQTLLVRPGIEMAVTYGPNDIVCRLVFSSGLITQQQANVVMDEVVPSSLRGKQLNHGGVSFGGGAATTLFTDYEHVNISLSLGSQKPTDSEPIQVTVTFKDAGCKAIARNP